MNKRGLVALVFLAVAWASLMLAPARADQPLTPFPSPLSTPSSKSGGISQAAGDTRYLKLDGTNWNTITGLVWTLAPGGTPGGDSLTFTNGGSSTLSPVLRVQQTSATPATGEDAFIQVMQQAGNLGDVGAEIAAVNSDFSKQFKMRVQTGNANWAPCNGNPEACGPGVALLTTPDIQGITIGPVSVNGPVNLYGDNIAFATNNGLRISSAGTVEFHPNAGVGGTFFHDQTGCTTCGPSADKAGLFYDTVVGGGGLQLSINNDSPSPIARAVANFTSSPVTENAASLKDTAVTTLVVGNYQCHGFVVLSESTAADGAKCAIVNKTATWGAGSSGAVTITSTTANTGDAGVDNGASMAPTTSLSVMSTGVCVADATIIVSAGGNAALQVAQNSHSTGTLTAQSGASLRCTRM